ncbi:site-specific recombinase XerD [Methylophilaceae bacterium 11]|nr:site-specific recombinase XerD [Methylophilaceae bacterium 11]
MKLASNLWKSRHGIYYFRYKLDGLDIKKSLKTRSPLIAKEIAYKLGFAMATSQDLLDQLLNDPNSIKTWTLETANPNIRISTDGSAEDHDRALEALKIVLASQQGFTAQNPASNSSRSYSLKESIDDYRIERDSTIKARTKQAWNTDFKQLADGLGESTPTHQIDVEAYTSWRIKVVDKLAPSSQDSKNNVYKNFFDWCVQRDRCKSNPVVPCKLGKNKRAELQQQLGRERLPYSTQDLTIIFSDEVRQAIKKPCLYWLPLIALYTGARLEEIASLELSTVRLNEDNIWTFEFGKTKTVSSIRTIPIHPELINAGLLQYIDDVKQFWPNANTLFPYMRPVSGRLTHRFSQDYGSFKKNLNIDSTKDFHSFRTTVIGIFKRARVSDEMRREYVGHEAKEKLDVHDKSYAGKTRFTMRQISTDLLPALNFEKQTIKTSPYLKGTFVPFLLQRYRKNQ